MIQLIRKIVMDEDLVQNGVMDAKIDPKVVMDLSIQNWWMELSATHTPEFVGGIC